MLIAIRILTGICGYWGKNTSTKELTSNTKSDYYGKETINTSVWSLIFLETCPWRYKAKE